MMCGALIRKNHPTSIPAKFFWKGIRKNPFASFAHCTYLTYATEPVAATYKDLISEQLAVSFQNLKSL